MPRATLRHIRGKEVSRSRESNLDLTHLLVPGDDDFISKGVEVI